MKERKKDNSGNNRQTDVQTERFSKLDKKKLFESAGFLESQKLLFKIF